MPPSSLRMRQLDESAATGSAYRADRADLGWCQGGEYVITDELGSPGWYSDEFERLLRKVGPPGITLSGFRLLSGRSLTRPDYGPGLRLRVARSEGLEPPTF